GDEIVTHWMESSFHLPKDLLVAHAPHGHAGALKRSLDAGHQAVELCQQVFVLLTRTLDALACRKTPAAAVSHLLLPFQIRRLMMDFRVPDEIGVQVMAQVVPRRVFRSPLL